MFGVKDLKHRSERINNIWKEEFGCLLRLLFDTNNIDFRHFCEQYGWHDSTIRYWLSGKRLPSHDSFKDLCIYLYATLNDGLISGYQISEKIKQVFKKHNYLYYYEVLKRKHPKHKDLAIETLVTFHCFANNDFSLTEIGKHEIDSSGFVRAVVFDFDGTLTCSQGNHTTWEMLWTSLGYDVRICQELHKQFDRNEISHDEWCSLTKEKFREKGFNKKLLIQISNEIELINGIEETFRVLEENNIKIYIVSGSVDIIIKNVMGDLCKYVDEVKSNIFRFDNTGILSDIIGTKYDFEGKADFITEIATELNISPKDILFIGNSINDRFAYESGAQTLCINPKLTDTSNQTVWNDCIITCNNLKDILSYIKLDI